jgi:hypothetical protein
MFVGAMTGNLDHFGVPALKVALGQLAARPEVDAHRIGAIGFCLGGSKGVLAFAKTPMKLVAGAGFEPLLTRFSKLLMARDFWSKGLTPLHFPSMISELSGSQ